MSVQIPILANIPAQTFDISLDGISYNMTAKWNSRSEFWTLDILDEDDNVIILGLCLKLGTFLLKQFNLNIGELIVVDDTNTGTESSLTNIGVSTSLVYFTQEELEIIEA